MTNDTDINYEPLPGYRLIERIGAGGYGEVWRAEAPGGLTKAIKLVFGKQHEKRATNERRALDHVRSVRHPFLLSLERIEVVDGRLLVVTELADGSLKDRFDQCRRDNKLGVPREELLGYLRDAADALDFMGEIHALQHLDIKPENLLLLANHVKVADFGLVKDVRQSQASLVGGMTPLYAAPEVFRGSPSRQSDQYSLAIVYQEMLTGMLPFVGNSAAELTLHHLNDEPDLSSLSAADRYSVSRALSKDPQHRYTNCREFVDSLIKSDAAAFMEPASAPVAQYSPQSNAVDPVVRETQPADFFDDEQPAGWNNRSAEILLDSPASDCQLFDLPPVDLASRDSRPAPTVVIGIGGTAGRVLSHFRRTLDERCGNPRELPAVQFLLVDTDSRGLNETSRDEATGLTADELLNLPLRRPQHYRENSQQLLHWLGRRWLYNIPRSLQTEGLRPLGRLALADHARVAGQRIRRAMVQALDPASLAKSSSTVGQGFRNDALRVIVVASISGGTGSGMSLDMGYAVRAILQKLGLAHGQIIGVMLHSTGRDARHSELARVNAYSWLAEFNHFQQFDNPYPGDVSCGLPAHAAGVKAFDFTYLIQLGENLDGAEYEQAAARVADYLRFNTLSPTNAFFDACRTPTGAIDAQSNQGGLRSFGVYRPAQPSTEHNGELASQVSQHVLSVWRGTATSSTVQTGETENAQIAQQLKLDVSSIAANSRALIEHELGGNPGEFLSRVLKEKAAGSQSNSANALAVVDSLFGRKAGSADEPQGSTLLGRTASDIVAPLLEKLRTEVRNSVMQRIDDPRQRLVGARRTINQITDALGRAKSELGRIHQAIGLRLVQLRAAGAAPESATNARGTNSNAGNPSLADEFFHMSLDDFTISATERVVQSLEADAKALSDEITSLGREVEQIVAAFDRTFGCATNQNDSVRNADGPAAAASNRLAEIASRVDAQLQADYIDANGGLLKTIMQGGRPRAQLSAKLHELSQKAVYQEMASGQSHAGSAFSGSEGNLSTALAMATPACLEFGGRRRTLAIVPAGPADDAAESTVRQALGASVTTVSGNDVGLTVCVEADGLSLPHIALDIVERRRDRVEFAERVHCRTDICWTTLVSTEAPMSVVWGNEPARQTQPQNAMSKTLVI